MDLVALTDFNLVAAAGGFGAASRTSGRPKATLSRRVIGLEQALGARLFERGSRSLRLTEAGQALFDRTQALLHEIDEAGETIAAGLTMPRGLLRVSAPSLFSQMAMGRIAAVFCAAHPAVELEVIAEDRVVDLVSDGYDVVIRSNPRRDSGLVGRCFMKDRLLLVAAPSLTRPVAGAGGAAPAVAAVASTGTVDALWTTDDGQAFEPRVALRLSSMTMVRDAVRAGAGVGLLPRSIVADDLRSGRLRSWGCSNRPEAEIWALHTSRRLVSAKVRVFVDFLAEAFSQGAAGLDGG